MKTTILLALALAAAIPAHAQIYRPDSLRGSHAPRAERHRDHGRNDRPSVHVGIGFNHGAHYGSPWRGYDSWRDGRGYYGYSPYRYLPSYGYYSGYGAGYPYYGTTGYYGSGYYGSGSAASNGLLLGALAGGIIGHNSGDFRHNGWRGAAWGAGAGWLLGSVLDANRRPMVYDSAPVVVQQAPSVQVQPQPASPTQPQQVTIINNYYNSSTPMSGVNGMFGR